MPEDRRGYRSKTELALEMVGRTQERGHLKAGWVAADDAFGMSPSFRDGLAALGMWYVLDVPSGFTMKPPEPAWTSVEYQGFASQQAEAPQRAASDWRSGPMPSRRRRGVRLRYEGSQGPRSYRFSAQRVRPTSRRKPGEIHWAIYRRNLDGRTPLLSVQCTGGYPVGDPGIRGRIPLAYRNGVRDGEKRRGAGRVRTRTWAGWHHHVALCLLGGAFLLSLQQAWGEKDAPDHGPQVPGAGNAAPGTVRT